MIGLARPTMQRHSAYLRPQSLRHLLISLTVVLHISAALAEAELRSSQARVAIIGSGVGGAFTAAFLHERLNETIRIDV